MYYLYIRVVILRALSRHSSIYRVFYNDKTTAAEPRSRQLMYYLYIRVVILRSLLRHSYIYRVCIAIKIDNCVNTPCSSTQVRFVHLGCCPRGVSFFLQKFTSEKVFLWNKIKVCRRKTKKDCAKCKKRFCVR